MYPLHACLPHLSTQTGPAVAEARRTVRHSAVQVRAGLHGLVYRGQPQRAALSERAMVWECHPGVEDVDVCV